MIVLLVLHTLMDMTVTAGDQLAVFLRRKAWQCLEEGSQVPDGTIFHPPFGPGRHPGSFDAMFDDPEAPGIKLSEVIYYRRCKAEIGRLRVQALVDFRVLDPGDQVASCTHGGIVTGTSSNATCVSQVGRRHNVPDLPGNRTLPRPGEQMMDQGGMGTIGCHINKADIDQYAADNHACPDQGQADKILFHGNLVLIGWEAKFSVFPTNGWMAAELHFRNHGDSYLHAGI